MLVIFYDGECGLCHNWIRWLVAKDRMGSLFRFAPIRGRFYNSTFSTDVSVNLPDSVIVLDEQNNFFTKAAAVALVLERMGGIYRLFSRLLRAVPPILSNRSYDLIAKVRKKIFKKPDTVCPFLDKETQQRFYLD